MPIPIPVGQLLFQYLPIITAAGSIASDLLKRGIGDQLAEQIGQHGKARLNKLHDRLLDFAQHKKDLPPNHDLQKALYLSFLSATEVIYQDRLQALGRKIDKHWLSGLKYEILNSLPRPVQPLSLNETEGPILDRKLKELWAEQARCAKISSSDLQARSPFGPSIDLLRSLAAELKRPLAIGDRLLDVILGTSPWYKDAGPTVQEIARQHLWEYSGKFFAEQIKTNMRVSRILSVELLADTGITLERVNRELAGATRKLGKIHDGLEALRELVESDYQEQFVSVDPNFLKQYETVELEPLLNIPVGNWACVVQKKSLQREAARLVTERALLSSRRIVFQIIGGEPGSGKTTTLRQVGALLAEQGCAVLEAYSDSDLSKIRIFLKRLTKKARCRLFVLVDNVYQDNRSGIIEFISDPGELLPVTLIATTPSYDDRTSEIRLDPTYVEMPDPVSVDELSDQELDDLRRLPEFRRLSRKRFELLTKSRRILPVMLALTGGRAFDRIIGDTALHLKKHNREIYEAWGVITTFGRWNLPVPNSLLEAILDNSHFGFEMRNSPDLRGSKGLIFPSTYPFKEGWFPGHQIIGQAAFDRVYSGRLKEYCEKGILQGKPDDSEHCVFLGRMFRYLCSSKIGTFQLARELFRDHERKVLKFADSSPESGVDWGSALLSLQRKELAKHYLMAARPATAWRALTRSSLLERIGESAKALQLAEQWCEDHPLDTVVRGFYLGLVGRSENPHITKALQATAKWLAEHKHDSYVRGRSLNLVQARGNKTEVLAALNATREWLARDEHQNDTFVRGNYVGLVQARGNKTEVLAALNATREWLARDEHQNDTFVRGDYLGLVQRRGNEPEVTTAVKATAEWLAANEHQNDTLVRGDFLGLVQARCKGQPIRNAIRDAFAWLADPAHVGDTHVRQHYLALVNKKGLEDEIKQAIAFTGEWLGRFGYDTTGRIRGNFLRLVEEHLPQELETVIAGTLSWLDKNPKASEAWVALVGGLARLRKFPEASKAAQAAAAANPEDTKVLQMYLGRCRKGMPEEAFHETIDHILSRSLQDSVARINCADWLSERKDYDKAQELFDTLPAPARESYSFNYAYGWHLHRQQKYLEAAERFRKVLNDQAEHQMAHEGLGQALRDLARQAEQFGGARAAEGYRKEAERHFNSAINRAQTLKVPNARFFAARGWLYYDWGRFDDALADFAAANRDEYHSLNGWGQGAVLVALKRYHEALEVLRKALELAPKPLESPASEEIPRLIAECENALRSPTSKS